jgi:hypothetical protein
MTRYYRPMADGDMADGCCHCEMRGINPATANGCFHEFRETEKRGGTYVLVCLNCNGRLPEGSNVERALRAKGIAEDVMAEILPTAPGVEPMTDQQIEAIEAIADAVVTGYQGPKLSLSFARGCVITLLRNCELPRPDDAWLNEVICDAAKFNEVEIDQAA